LAELIEDARERLYRLHWQLRSRLVPFDLWEGLALLRESERWPRARLDDMRDRKLAALVRRFHAVSPHYRRMLAEHGVRPADIRGVADIVKLPVKTQAILREHAAQLHARDMPAHRVEAGQTGGTTGVPVQVLRDLAGTTWMRAAYWRGFGWGGLTLGAPWVQLFGGSLGRGETRRFNRLKNRFAGKLFLPAFDLREDNVGTYVRAIQASGARHLVGYASACHQLAVFTQKAGLSLRLDAVFPTAELMPDAWAECMASVFGARVLPYYGCGEVQSLGYSCPEAPGTYHACDEHAVLEVETAGGAARLEGEGSFLITDLDNRAMPLIRYRNGDAGVLAAPGCACGRTLARIQRVDGRVSDALVDVAGALVPGVIAPHAFRRVQAVDAYQIVQRRPGQAVLRIVRGTGYDAALEEPKLRAILGRHLGEGSVIEFEYPAELPKTPAGKARFVINEVLARDDGLSDGFRTG
jgi:phenylacetate-CoA ligase